MSRYLTEGTPVPFQTAQDRKALVGKTIRYLRHSDIDKSGRGYFFPRTDQVIEAVGRQLVFASGDSVLRSQLAEVNIRDNAPMTDPVSKRGQK